MNIQKRAMICIIISVGLMVLALLMSLFGFGINMGIDFAGGLRIKYEMGETFDLADVETALQNAGMTESQITQVGDAKTELQIRVKSIGEKGVEELRASLETELSAKYTQMKIHDADVSYVGGVASGTLVQNAIFAVISAAILMLIYIAIRFDPAMGAASVLGLMHDVLIMVAFMVFARGFVQMNSTFIAAMLTIVGYSINNTIIIFDRIRENAKKKTAIAMSSQEIVSLSIKQSLGRTINTTLTTLCTIVALYVLGVDSIKEFALPIIVGILAGAYSANLINGYVWAFLRDTVPALSKKKK